MIMANEPVIDAEEMGLGIHFIRGRRVMLDSDLARIYGVETKRLKEQFKRNRNRSPVDFAFQLERQELAILRSQIATSRLHGGVRYLPIAFTEHGAIMLASVLNSDRAIEMSILVVRAFARLREIISGNQQLARQFAELERRVGKHDEAIATLFEAIKQLLEPSSPKTRREIGFHVKEQAVRYRTRNGK